MQHKPYGPYERYIKRPLDCFLSSLALIVLSPIILITAILVRMRLGTPITGYAQVHGRNFVMWDERCALDVQYAKKITFIGDMKIILQTIIKVLKRSDVAEKRIPPLDQVRREELEKQAKENK